MNEIKYPNQHLLYKAIYQIYFPAIRPFMARVLVALPNREGEVSIQNEADIDIKDVPHLFRKFWAPPEHVLLRNPGVVYFESLFDRNKDVRSTIGIIGEARNLVAHPDTQDIDPEYARARLYDIAEVLGFIHAAEEKLVVLALRDELIRNTDGLLLSLGEQPPITVTPFAVAPPEESPAPISLPHVAESRQDIVPMHNANEHLELAPELPLIWDTIADAYNNLTPVRGVVKRLRPFGAFVNLGGVEGLVPKSELTWNWKRIEHPSKVVSVGDEVEALVIRVDREKQEISLSMKQMTRDPWLDAEEKYPVGAIVQGTVVNAVSYGAFLQLEDGVAGLIHITEMAWERVRHPSEVVSVGERVEAVVLEISNLDRRISFGLRQLQPNP